jgi:hypothetical protein
VNSLDQPRRTYKQGASCSGTPETNIEDPPHARIKESKDEKSNEDEREENDTLSQGSDGETNWTPGSLYLQRKLQSDKAIDDVTYRLRSRVVGRSGPDPEPDKRETANSSQLIDKAVQNSTSPSKGKCVPNHSYTLRVRTRTAPTTPQVE